MKNSVKVILMTLAMVFTIALVNAQPRDGQRGGNPTEQAKKQTARMTSNLNLNAKQASRIEAINLKYAKIHQKKRDEMHQKREAGQEIDRENMKAQMMKLKVAQEEEIKAVLTPTQITKFDGMKKEHQIKRSDLKKRGKKGKKGKGKKGAKANINTRAKSQTQKMASQLELSAAQTKRVQAINLKYAQKKQDLKESSKTTGAKYKAMMRQLHQEQEAEIKAVLTPAQIKTWEASKAERKGKGKRGKKSKFNISEN